MSIAAYPKYESYLDSGVDWIGERPAEWDIKPLRRFISVQSGDIISKEAETPEGYPIYGGNGVRGFTSRFNTKAPIILIGRVGALCGNVHVVHENVWASEHAYRAYPKSKFILSFLSYAIKSIDLNRFAIRTAQPLLNSSIVHSQKVAIPPLPEQRAIASFLDKKCTKIDEAVRIKEEQINLLRERRQILIQQAVTRGLNPDVPMKDSGIDWIGEIPAHWEVRRNFALFREIKQLGNADLPVLSVSIHSGVSKEELSEEENIRSIVKIENRSSYKEVLPGDIAYNMMRAWQGGIGAVHTHGMVSPAYVVARPVGYLAGDYFELLYRTPNFIRQMDAGSKGIADFRKRLYWDDFRDLMTTLPPLAEQKEIIQYSEQISEKVSHAISIKQEQIAKLKEYKTSLINAAVTGKIKVI